MPRLWFIERSVFDEHSHKYKPPWAQDPGVSSSALGPCIRWNWIAAFIMKMEYIRSDGVHEKTSLFFIFLPIMKYHCWSSFYVGQKQHERHYGGRAGSWVGREELSYRQARRCHCLVGNQQNKYCSSCIMTFMSWWVLEILRVNSIDQLLILDREGLRFSLSYFH